MHAGALGVLGVSEWSIWAGESAGRPVVFGLIADLHHGLSPTALERLETFFAALEPLPLDFILQMGDFCYGDAGSRPCLALWNQFQGPRYHVLGNHDMDRVGKQEIMDAWGMEQNYYSFDVGSFHFVILDCNYLKLENEYRDYAKGNYFQYPSARAHVSPEQLEWLRADLRNTDKPTLVFTHQGLAMDAGTRNQADVKKIIRETNQRGGPGRVVACFCGHHHVDRLTHEDAIPHLWINSASYHWVGPQYGRMAHYRDALYAVVTLTPGEGIHLDGVQSEFIPPSPAERGYPKADAVQPRIADRSLPFR